MKTIPKNAGLDFWLRMFVLLPFVALGVWVVSKGERVRLEAVEDLNLYRDVASDGQDVVFAKLDAGEIADVIGCADTKSMIYPKVRLEDGQEGYRIFGNFRLLRSSRGIFRVDR